MTYIVSGEALNSTHSLTLPLNPTYSLRVVRQFGIVWCHVITLFTGDVTVLNSSVKKSSKHVLSSSSSSEESSSSSDEDEEDRSSPASAAEEDKPQRGVVCVYMSNFGV